MGSVLQKVLNHYHVKYSFGLFSAAYFGTPLKIVHSSRVFRLIISMIIIIIIIITPLLAF